MSLEQSYYVHMYLVCLSMQSHLEEYHLIQYTVEPPNKGHFGSRAFVLFSEVVLWWQVRANMQLIAPCWRLC